MPSWSNKQINLFFQLLQAGLWEKEVLLNPLDGLNFTSIYNYAEEQSVSGLIAAGIELSDVRGKKEDVLQLVGLALQLEQRNVAMNHFIEGLFTSLRKNGIYALLIKGQGVAQCYERPLWRSSGDVDVFLTADNYQKSKTILQKIGTQISNETEKNKERLNAEYQVGEWLVELHGTQHANLSKRMDIVLDQIQNDVFSSGKVRAWKNGETDIFLPAETEDAIFVFAHILQHLFLGGIGLRQVCDWCRLLWTYCKSIDQNALESYIRKMGVMTEWKVFACIAVNNLGMPVEAMPFFDKSYEKKSERLLEYIIEVGNFGHNKDDSHLRKYSGIKRKLITCWKQAVDSMRLSRVFPVDAPRFLGRFFVTGVKEII